MSTPSPPLAVYNRRRWRIGFLSLILALIAIATILGQLTVLLESMHPPGRVSGSVLNVSPEVVGSWYRQSAEIAKLDPTFNNGQEVARTWLLWDAGAFVWVYAALGLLVLWAAKAAQEPDAPVDQALLGIVRSRFSWIALACLVVFDQLENLTLRYWIDSMWALDDAVAIDESLIRCAIADCATVQRALTFVKFLAAGLLLATPLIAGVVIGIRHVPRLWRTIKRLRAQVIVVMVVALLLQNEQVEDAFRAWDPVRVAWSVAAALMLSAGVAISGWRLLIRPIRQPAQAELPRPALWVGGAIASAAAAALWLGDLRGLALPFGFLGVVFLLSLLVYDLVPAVDVSVEEEATYVGVLPRLLGALVFFFVAITALRALAPEVFYQRSEDPLGWDRLHLFLLSLLLIGFSGALFGYLLPRLTDHPGQRGAAAQAAIGRHRVLIAMALTGLSILVWGLVLWFPYQVPVHIGATGILLIFLTIVVFLATALVTRSEALTGHWKLPPVLRLLGLRRVPLLLIILLWSILAGHVDDDGGYHDVRRIPASAQAATQLDFDTYFDHWEQRQIQSDAEDATPQAGSSRRGIPLILIAASGGGIRAAFWTATVLDCIIEANQRIHEDCDRGQRPGEESSRAIFAVSGISGGSLGLASYESYLLEPEKALANADGDWVMARLRRDFLSATLARNLFVDTPLAWVRPDSGVDHAEILERDWERAWGPESPLGRGLKEVMRLENDLPLTLFNSLSSSDGCRFNVSLLVTNGPLGPESCSRLRGLSATGAPSEPQLMIATHDLTDFITDEDLPLSTAVHLSARFPYVSPGGRLAAYGQDGEEEAVVYLVDGGTRDSSAASPLVELYPALMERVDEYNRSESTTCLVPMFVQIDNGYSTYGPHTVGSKPEEIFVPINAGLSSLRANADAARQSAQRLFLDDEIDHLGTEASFEDAPLQEEADEMPPRYVQVTTKAHPGVQAPLGWLLSETSANDLRRQIAVARDELNIVGRWLRASQAGKLRCSPSL